MRSSKIRLFGGILALALGLLIGLTRAGEPSGTVTASVGSPNPVASGDNAKIALDASATAPVSYTGVTYTGPTWNWEASGADGLSFDQSSETPTATLNTAIVVPGTYTLTVKVTATWSGDDDTTINASDEKTITLVVVGVQKLQYFQPGPDGGSYVEVSGPLYVLAGQSLKLKAIPTADAFPAGYPAWLEGEADGDTVTVSFEDLSTTTEDYQSVIGSCGLSKRQADVIVYDLIPTLTPQDNFEGRDLDSYGVCELIDLTFSTTPSGISAYDLGGLKWQISQGSGLLTDNGNGTGVYECTDVADTVKLTLQLNGGAMLAQKKETPPKDIVPPDAHACSQTDDTGLWHEANKQGCLVRLTFWAKGPKNVSFAKIEVREGESDPSVGDGIFEKLNGKIHTPGTSWNGLEALAKGKGYEWGGQPDESGFKNPLEYGDGDYQQNIFMMYRKAIIGENLSVGFKYAECLSIWEATKDGGVASVWKDPVGFFWLAGARGSNPFFGLPQPE